MVGMANQTTSIAGVPLAGYVYNASGPRCTTPEELETLAQSESAAVMMKTCTIEPREGNPEPRYATFDAYAIQAMGLPNHGYKAYVEYAGELTQHNKPVIASVAGFSVPEYVTMVDAFQTGDVSLIELNLSCPNIEGKPQVAYDFEQTEAVLKAVEGHSTVPLGLKLPAFLDSVLIDRMSALIEKYGVAFVTCVNSIGNALIIDPDTQTPAIKARRGFGGLSGPAIKPIALGNVRAFYERLGDRVDIIGVGGIESGVDAFEFLLAGASSVQVGANYEDRGPSCFSRINRELSDILEGKGYATVKEARGTLREWE
jgi:dihydroorotate dehydrogenase (fumarate)